MVCNNASEPRSDKKCFADFCWPDVVLNDTLTTTFDRLSNLQSVLGVLCFMNSNDVPFCILVITCTTPRPSLGLHPHQYFKVMSFLRSDKVKVIGLARLCRRLKKDTASEFVWMHPENSIVHETSIMFVS